MQEHQVSVHDPSFVNIIPQNIAKHDAEKQFRYYFIMNA